MTMSDEYVIVAKGLASEIVSLEYLGDTALADDLRMVQERIVRKAREWAVIEEAMSRRPMEEAEE